MKRIWGLLAALLLALSLAVTVGAEEVSPAKAVMAEAKRVYQFSRSTAGRRSFQGFCGLMTSHQLYHMGINRSIIVNDGNRQFDYYRKLEKTDAGYYISAYSAQEYNLEEALNYLCCNGQKDVYNILVGFQWTTTQAGARYGHACVINAILDGKVYFVESFYTSLGGNEGNVIVCSVKEFAEYFDSWMIYEGLIHFGTVEDTCQYYPSGALLQTRFDSVLRSAPTQVGKKDCVELRQIAAGERLHATGVFRTREGELFYRVRDGELKGYVAANAVSFLEVYPENLTLEDLSFPETVEENTDAAVAGKVDARWGQVAAVSVTVTDDKGELILRERKADCSDLSGLNEELDLSLLVPGLYQVEIAADAASNIVRDNKVVTTYTHNHLYNGVLGVGQPAENLEQPPVSLPAGWSCQGGKWYFTRQDKVCTGWLQHCGVDHYLDDKGAAVSGWQELEDGKRYFSGFGALVTGWLRTETGTYFLGSDGTPVTGWQTFGKDKYYFGPGGVMVAGVEMADGDKVYVLAPDGKATEKPAETK